MHAPQFSTNGIFAVIRSEIPWRCRKFVLVLVLVFIKFVIVVIFLLKCILIVAVVAVAITAVVMVAVVVAPVLVVAVVMVMVADVVVVVVVVVAVAGVVLAVDVVVAVSTSTSENSGEPRACASAGNEAENVVGRNQISHPSAPA